MEGQETQKALEAGIQPPLNFLNITQIDAFTMGYYFLSSFQALAFAFSVCPVSCTTMQRGEAHHLHETTFMYLPTRGGAQAELSFQHNSSSLCSSVRAEGREQSRTLSIEEASWRPGSWDPVTVLVLISPATGGWPEKSSAVAQLCFF